MPHLERLADCADVGPTELICKQTGRETIIIEEGLKVVVV